MTLHYDYSASKAYCEQIGLEWLGDEYGALIDADTYVFGIGLNQEQINELMRKHLWQTKTLFTPKNYKYRHRLMIALYFLTGWKPK